MTKQEFLNRYDAEKLNIGEYIMVLDTITDESLVIGCALMKECGKFIKQEREEVTI